MTDGSTPATTTGTAATGTAPVRARRRPSVGIKLAFSLASVVVVLGALEVGARVVGFGEVDKFGGSLLPYQQVYPPLFEPVADSARPRARPRDPRLVDRGFPTAGSARRIFVLGESAVIGLGGAENNSFARALERDLRVAGSQDVVVNCGIVALDSRQMLTIARDILKWKPETVVIHVGNNECLEEHAIRFIQYTTGLPFSLRFEEALSGSQLFLGLKQRGIESKTRKLTRATFRYDELHHGETKVAEVTGIILSPIEIAAAVAAHARRLREIVELAKAAGSRVILMTVATNLEWTSPKESPETWLETARRDVSLHADLSPRDDGSTALLLARESLEKSADDPTVEPLVHWRRLFQRACVKRALGDAPGALADFRRANDEDPHLRRTLTSMNENMRALAKAENVTLVDGEQILAQASKDGITGFEMLYDYVHFAPEGNERLGAALAKAIMPAVDPSVFNKCVVDARERLARRPSDALEVEDYFGWNGDRADLTNKDLWKYDDAHARLCQDDPAKRATAPGKADSGTATAQELIWAANYHALRVGDEDKARELYARARALDASLAPVIDKNVAWLNAR